MSDKVKREQEEKYFAEQERKKREELRKKLNEEKERLKKESRKNEHWMKCPKCGHDLKEVGFEDVLIDKCQTCEGIWLDEGELELLLEGRKAQGFISRFISTVTTKE
ncbi:MAG: zf-TFIIB domain-containing protein [bacterium]